MEFLRLKRCFFLIVILAGFGWVARADISREYQVKAVFLYNFAQFTDWPSSVFAAADDPIVIGVLGSDPFGSFLDETVKGEVIKGRHIKVIRFKTVAEIQTCHILYIGQSEANRVERILDAVQKKPVLTVTDLDVAASRRIIIRFIAEHNRVRFQINLEAAKEAQLTLSSKLLRVAIIAEK